MILFKKQVGADETYSFANQSNCVIFDAHNDTPYNMGISFGHDTGINSADYYIGPHGILTGIRPTTNAPSLNNVRWTGTIYVYTETPLGTGLTNLASAPAFQITIIGYPTGYQPQGTTSMSRMTATPNAVSTVGGASSSIQNDANVSGTSIVEATVSGDSSSAVSWTNDAVLVNGDAAHPGTVSLDNAQITTDGSGNLTIKGTLKVSQATALGGGLNTNIALLVRPLSTGEPGLVVAGLASQTGNLLEVQNSTFANLFVVDPSGNVTINGGAGINITPQPSSVALFIKSTGTAQDGLVIRAVADTTPHMLAVENSSNTVTWHVDSLGNFAGTNLTSTGSASLDNGAITTDGSGNIAISGTAANNSLSVTSGKTSLDNGNLTSDGSGNLTGASLKTNGNLFFHSGAKLNTLNSFFGTGTGNFNTFLPSSSNIFIAFNPCSVSGSTQTIGGSIAQTSHVTTGAGLAWQGTAWQWQ